MRMPLHRSRLDRSDTGSTEELAMLPQQPRFQATVRAVQVVVLGLAVAAGACQCLRAVLAQEFQRPTRRDAMRRTHDPINPRGPYLGQTRPGMIPKVFAPDFICSRDGSEYSIAFSPDGNEIYFSRYTPGDDSNSIWVTRQVNGVWTWPRRAEFTGRCYNSEPFVTRDNRRIYFISNRDSGENSFQLWTVTRAAAGWGPPTRLGPPFSTNTKMCPTVATNGNIYFTEFVGNLGRFYMAQLGNDGFETPLPLTDVVNTFARMGHAFVAPDESYLVFDAVAGGPKPSGAALYVSFRGPDRAWLPPVRLGDDVNATANQYCPVISPDNKYLFFTCRNGDAADIWWVDARVVFDLKPAELGGP